jgi:hypothetical protein
MSDEDEEVYGSYKLLPKEKIVELAEEIGKTNLRFNNYNALLKIAETYEQEGLNPQFYLNLFTGEFLVTSVEYMEKRFN